MAPIMNEEGAVRRLALASGLSEQTIRTVASTGVVSTLRTAKAIEVATDGAVPASETMQPGARGERVYSAFPGDAIMRLAIRRRCEVGTVLASVGLTHQDLSMFSHNGDSAPKSVKGRIQAALNLLAASAEEERA